MLRTEVSELIGYLRHFPSISETSDVFKIPVIQNTDK